MGVTPAGVVQTVTQAVKCSRHALSHLHCPEGAVVVVAQGGEEEGERVKDGQGALQPGGRASAVMRKRA